MAFSKRTWLDRVSEYPARRTLTSNSSTTVVTVTRSEGVVSQEGDAFNAENMNDLEDRIKAEFDRLNATTNVTIPASWGTTQPYSITINVTGMVAGSNPGYALDPSVTNPAVAEAYGFIDSAKTGAGTMTFYCLRDRPLVAIPIILKGV